MLTRSYYPASCGRGEWVERPVRGLRSVLEPGVDLEALLLGDVHGHAQAVAGHGYPCEWNFLMIKSIIILQKN